MYKGAADTDNHASRTTPQLALAFTKFTLEKAINYFYNSPHKYDIPTFQN